MYLSLFTKNLMVGQGKDFVQKGMTKWNFPKSHIFWKISSDSKQDIRKSWDLDIWRSSFQGTP